MRRADRVLKAAATGVGPQDRVVDNPPDSLANGELVRVTGVEAKSARDAHGAG